MTTVSPGPSLHSRRVRGPTGCAERAELRRQMAPDSNSSWATYWQKSTPAFCLSINPSPALSPRFLTRGREEQSSLSRPPCMPLRTCLSRQTGGVFSHTMQERGSTPAGRSRHLWEQYKLVDQYSSASPSGGTTPKCPRDTRPTPSLGVSTDVQSPRVHLHTESSSSRPLSRPKSTTGNYNLLLGQPRPRHVPEIAFRGYI